MQTIAVIGGGLAGCETAWQAARFGVRVVLLEMKPGRFSPAHKSQGLAELVCSNSFRSMEPETAVGLLKQEMSAAGSLVMVAANQTRVPAGKALAVDRERFSALITQKIQKHPLIQVVQEEVASLDDPELAGFDAVVVAAGPLASEPLARSLGRAIGQDFLYFYDAIAPIVAAESVNMDRAFWASRYKPDQHDYLNCPMTEPEYLDFVEELLAADKVKAREFEDQAHFEGCLPIETMAERGTMTLAYGPMKPVGLTDPRTGERPFAVVQLRPENLDRTMLGLVGFQTKLTYPEQKRVFRMIPCLAKAEFVRLGSMHRNTFVNAPRVLTPELMIKTRPGFYLAGQISGVEGYVESAACGMWLGLHLGAKLTGREVSLPPVESALGALLAHLRTAVKNFQPSNVNFGLTPPLNRRAGKIKRKYMYAERAEKAFGQWLEGMGELPGPGL